MLDKELSKKFQVWNREPRALVSMISSLNFQLEILVHQLLIVQMLMLDSMRKYSDSAVSMEDYRNSLSLDSRKLTTNPVLIPSELSLEKMTAGMTFN